jgi:hypothetical protein
MDPLMLLAILAILNAMRKTPESTTISSQLGATDRSPVQQTAGTIRGPSGEGIRQEGNLYLTLDTVPSTKLVNRASGHVDFKFEVISSVPTSVTLMSSESISAQMQMAIIGLDGIKGSTPQWFRDLAVAIVPNKAAQRKFRLIDNLMPDGGQDEVTVQAIERGLFKVIRRWGPASRDSQVSKATFAPGQNHVRYFTWNFRNELAERIAAGVYMVIAYIKTTEGALASGWMKLAVL